jgi:hypothetical protein
MVKEENKGKLPGLIGDGWMRTGKKKFIHVKKSESLGPFKK